MKDSLIIRNGKFFRNNVEIPIEFGNIEQIKVLKASNKFKQDLKKGVEVELDIETRQVYDALLYFRCACNSILSLASEGDYNCNEDEIANEFVGLKTYCSNCDLHFIVRKQHGELVVKELK